MMLFSGCQQEQEAGFESALDMDIRFEYQDSELPEYLSLSLENESESPLTLPDGLMVLEFTSYSGSIHQMIPLSPEKFRSDRGWDHYKSARLLPGEKVDLLVDIRQLLPGISPGISELLPADDYTLNAFVTAEESIKDLPLAFKVRSNYLDLEKERIAEKLSQNNL